MVNGNKRSSNSTRPNVFAYSDYRGYLKDQFEFCKRQNPGFSFRTFSRLAGFSSPNFLKLVYDGKRNLTIDSIQRVSKGFKLSRPESEFLENLVLFNQSQNAEEKAQFYSRMVKSQAYRQIRAIEKDQYDYYSNWYHVVIRELVDTDDFREDPEWIASRVSPKITARQAADAIQLLLKLKFLVRNADGQLTLSEANLSTGPEVQSLAITQFHQHMLKAASDALEEKDPKIRDISGITVALADEQLNELKKRIYQFRRSTLAWLASVDSKKNQVYQLNLQLIPLTQSRGEKRS